jgi:hypothetical protein
MPVLKSFIVNDSGMEVTVMPIYQEYLPIPTAKWGG